MCGIAGIFNIKSQTPELRSKALKMAQKIRHRGPDWSGIYVGGSAILAHERLSTSTLNRVDNLCTRPTASKSLPSTVRYTTTAISVHITPESTPFRRVRTAKSSSPSTKTKASISSKN